jgi:hypothetical protein
LARTVAELPPGARAANASPPTLSDLPLQSQPTAFFQHLRKKRPMEFPELSVCFIQQLDKTVRTHHLVIERSLSRATGVRVALVLAEVELRID